jgi:hypothetical protein
LIAFLVVIVLGSIVATRVLANSYGFHRSVGFNLFHVYPPWSYFVWVHQWDHTNNHALFAQALGIGSTVTPGGFFVHQMKEILGKAKTGRELLKGVNISIDCYPA